MRPPGRSNRPRSTRSKVRGPKRHAFAPESPQPLLLGLRLPTSPGARLHEPQWRVWVRRAELTHCEQSSRPLRVMDPRSGAAFSAQHMPRFASAAYSFSPRLHEPQRRVSGSAHGQAPRAKELFCRCGSRTRGPVTVHRALCSISFFTVALNSFAWSRSSSLKCIR